MISEISQELGPDWGISQGGLESTSEVYKNRIAPHNSVKGYTCDTVIHSFSTGNELVIHIKEKDINKEAFRQPLESEMDWTQFKKVLKDHYFEQINNAL